MKTWIMNHNRCFVGRPHFRELWLCLWGPLLNMLCTHMEVFPSSRKNALGSEPLEATGSNVGQWKKQHFFTLTTKMMGWCTRRDKVPPLTTFLNLHMFFITTRLNFCLPCFHSHCLPPGMCLSMTSMKTNLRNVSVSSFSITSSHASSSSFASPTVTLGTVCRSDWWKEHTNLHLGPARCLWKKNWPHRVLCGVGRGPGLIWDSPQQIWVPQACWREDSGLLVTSAVVTLANCPHVSCWTWVSPCSACLISALTDHGILYWESPWSHYWIEGARVVLLISRMAQWPLVCFLLKSSTG